MFCLVDRFSEWQSVCDATEQRRSRVCHSLLLFHTHKCYNLRHSSSHSVFTSTYDVQTDGIVQKADEFSALITYCLAHGSWKKRTAITVRSYYPAKLNKRKMWNKHRSFVDADTMYVTYTQVGSIFHFTCTASRKWKQCPRISSLHIHPYSSIIFAFPSTSSYGYSHTLCSGVNSTFVSE